MITEQEREALLNEIKHTVENVILFSKLPLKGDVQEEYIEKAQQHLMTTIEELIINKNIKE